MIALSLTVAALAAPPTLCDPGKDTAALGAGGFCLDEAGYLEVGDLRKQVTTLEAVVHAKDGEIEAFEDWKARQTAVLKYTVKSMTSAHERGIDLVVETCTADLATCRQRNRRDFMERHGFALGLTAGVISTVALTAITLKVYGGAVEC